MKTQTAEIIETPDGMWKNTRTGTQYKSKTLAFKELNPDSTEPNHTRSSAHTPAPWRVVSCSDSHDRKRFSSIVAESPTNRDFPFVAQVTRLSDTDETPEAQANARLIAAAPDLLAACKAAQRFLDDLEPIAIDNNIEPNSNSGLDWDTRFIIQDAIAKANQ